MKRFWNPWTVVADVLMLVLTTFLLMVCLLVIIPPTIKKAELDYHPKAEYMIVMDWDNNRNTDLDLWLKDPEGKLVWYRNREIVNISLDRDSRGFLSNQTMINGEPSVSPNEEIITIRALVPGDYSIGASYYSGGNDPIDFTVKLIKINPKLTIVATYEGHFESVKEIQKPFQFRIERNGDLTVLPKNDEPFLPMGTIP